MSDPAAFIYANLGGNAFFQAFYVADDTDHFAAGVERVQGAEGDFQGVAVEGAEAFVEEEGVNRGFVTDEIG